MSSGTVLLVAPPRREREVLAAALHASGFEVRTVADLGDALRLLRERPTHAVILGEGVEHCGRVRAMDPVVGLVAVTDRDGIDARIAALAAGADDCLTRPFAARELVARVQAVTRRVALAAGSELRYADLRLDLDAHAGWRGTRPLRLTGTELRLLARLLGRPEVVVSRHDLLVGVWGHDPGPTSNCLGVYVGYLRRKLELGGEPRLLHTVRGAGYVVRAGATEEQHKNGDSLLTAGADARLSGQQSVPHPRGVR